jgi:transposase-like protein
MVCLEANGGIIKRTARELGIPAPTLRAWRDQGTVIVPPEKALALIDARLEKLQATRLAGLNRMLALMPQETDLYKITGATKIAFEMAMTEILIRYKLTGVMPKWD